MEKTISLEQELSKAIKKGCPRVNSCNYPISLGEFPNIVGFVREYCGNGKHEQCPAAQREYTISSRPSLVTQEKSTEERRKNGTFNSVMRAVLDFYKQHPAFGYR
jgi:hypothetical protein